MNIQNEEEEESLILGEPVDQYGLPLTPQGEDIEFQKFKDHNRLTIPENAKQEIVHKIIYGDTLEGLSLTYDVPIRLIKERNGIHSDEIYYLKEVVIPNPKFERSYTTQELEHVKIEEFTCYMTYNERSEKTARYYLS